MYADILKSAWTYNMAKKIIPELDELTTKSGFLSWRFEQMARVVHGNKYNYTLADPKNKTTKVTIICPIHGEFQQTPREHITRKHGCRQCAVDDLRIKKSDFITRAKAMHGDLYNYSKLPETLPDNNSKVTIICKIHGPFQQEIASHLKGYGCAKCSNRELLGVEGFISKAKEIHGNSFDYSKVGKYIGNKVLVPITCNTCNRESFVIPNNHLRGHGCKYCVPNESGGELEVRKYVESLGFETRKHIMKDGRHIDILVPELNIGFEYNGIYWHSSAHKDKNYHLNKTESANKEGINLIHIWENDWLNKPDIIKDIILSKLGKTKRVYARQTKVIKVSNAESKEFLSNNHIQGYAKGSSINLGLEKNGELLMLITLGKPRFDREYGLELFRMASKQGYTVVGGASKLLSKVDGNILSYARKDYSNGSVYKKLGFELLRTTPVDYWYTDINGNIVSRYKAMKKNLETLLPNFNPELTEEQNMVKHGFHKIHGCGNLVYGRADV